MLSTTICGRRCRARTNDKLLETREYECVCHCWNYLDPENKINAPVSDLSDRYTTPLLAELDPPNDGIIQTQGLCLSWADEKG
jgi:hypothetical protein